MTQQEKPFTSGEAFYEARQNIKAAEQFADHNNIEKAYLAAFIAEKWTGIAQSLTLREQSARWNDAIMPMHTLQMVDSETVGGPIPVPDSWHSESCWHLWEPGTNRCRECSDEYTADTTNQPCPSRCLHLPPTEEKHEHDTSCFHVFKDGQHTCSRCGAGSLARGLLCSEGPCPAMHPAPKHEHGPECEHVWMRITFGGYGQSATKCAHGCDVTYRSDLDNAPCPAACPAPKHEHGPECAHRWRFADGHHFIEDAKCDNDCGVACHADVLRAPCPAMHPVPKHEHGPECAHAWASDGLDFANAWCNNGCKTPYNTTEVCPVTCSASNA